MFLVALSVEIHVEQALCRTGLGAAMLRFCGRVRCVRYILLCVGSLSGLRVVGPVWHYGMYFILVHVSCSLRVTLSVGDTRGE
jgi:hypothetical protein